MIKAGGEQEVFALVERGFDEFVRSDCTEEGINEFIRATRVMVFDRPGNHFIMVADRGGRITGMVDVMENTHICLLFVDSSYQRRGIGRQLLERAVSLCRERKLDLTEIDVHSSLWAVAAYQSLGFKQTKPEQEKNGIRFVEIVRKLEPPGG
jgi:GNAT superfamily N-acetyltransferase